MTMRFHWPTKVLEAASTEDLLGLLTAYSAFMDIALFPDRHGLLSRSLLSNLRHDAQAIYDEKIAEGGDPEAVAEALCRSVAMLLQMRAIKSDPSILVASADLRRAFDMREELVKYLEGPLEGQKESA